MPTEECESLSFSLYLFFPSISDFITLSHPLLQMKSINYLSEKSQVECQSKN